jgi:hypothetical protein
LKSFVELLVVADDKASGAVFAKVAEHISDHQLASIPGCLLMGLREDGSEVRPGETIAEGEKLKLVVNFDVLFACAYGRAWFEDHSITYEEVRSRIPATDTEKIQEMIRELYYFYSNMSREEVEGIFPSQPVEEPDANPPEAASEPADSLSLISSET